MGGAGNGAAGDREMFANLLLDVVDRSDRSSVIRAHVEVEVCRHRHIALASRSDADEWRGLPYVRLLV